MNYGKHGCRTPDTPFSLFEGSILTILSFKINFLWMKKSFGALAVNSLRHFLFAGMAGTIYFLADILQPMKARFPAFEV